VDVIQRSSGLRQLGLVVLLVLAAHAAVSAQTATGFAARRGNGEKDAMVIETTPRIRRSHPNWTKGKLAPWTNTAHPVRISGWLFFDTEHRHDIGHLRATLWEIQESCCHSSGEM
jgi:hypothetical protein